MARRSIFRDLPIELQNEVARYLNPSEVVPSLSHTLDPSLIEERLKKNTLPLVEKLAYYEKVGYQRGIYDLLANGRFLDEGMSSLLLREVGKKGDSKMLSFLRDHGIVNIDEALASGIESRQNSFVRKWIDSPISDVRLLVQSALDGDNLEMIRELATRGMISTAYFDLRTNRTSFWLVKFCNATVEMYATGFGDTSNVTSYIHKHVYYSLLSDLTEPLPYTYDQIRVNAQLAGDFVKAIWSGKTTNYTRMERLLDRLIEDRMLGTRDNIVDIERDSQGWIRAFLPLVGNPQAAGIIERCDQLLGPLWTEITSPITSGQQLALILSYIPPEIQGVHGFIPIQPEAIQAWLELCISGDDRRFYRGLDFILYYHPGGRFSFVPNPARSRTFTNMEGGPFDFHAMLLRFFKVKPIPVMNQILTNRLISVWNELSPHLQLPPLNTRDGVTGLQMLFGGASRGGANGLCDALRQMYIKHLETEGKTPDEIEQKLIEMHSTVSTYGKFPRLDIVNSGTTSISVKPIVSTYNKKIREADTALAANETFIAERLRFLRR